QGDVGDDVVVCSAHGGPVEPAPARGGTAAPTPSAQDGDGRRLKRDPEPGGARGIQRISSAHRCSAPRESGNYSVRAGQAQGPGFAGSRAAGRKASEK